MDLRHCRVCGRELAEVGGDCAVCGPALVAPIPSALSDPTEPGHPTAAPASPGEPTTPPPAPPPAPGASATTGGFVPTAAAGPWRGPGGPRIGQPAPRPPVSVSAYRPLGPPPALPRGRQQQRVHPVVAGVVLALAVGLSVGLIALATSPGDEDASRRSGAVSSTTRPPTAAERKLADQVGRDTRAKAAIEGFCGARTAVTSQPPYVAAVPGQWAFVEMPDSFRQGSLPDESVPFDPTTFITHQPDLVDDPPRSGEVSLGPPVAIGPEADHQLQAGLAICVTELPLVLTGHTCQYVSNEIGASEAGGTPITKEIALDAMRVEVFELRTARLLRTDVVQPARPGCPRRVYVTDDGPVIIPLTQDLFVSWARAHLDGATVR